MKEKRGSTSLTTGEAKKSPSRPVSLEDHLYERYMDRGRYSDEKIPKPALPEPKPEHGEIGGRDAEGENDSLS